MTAFDYAALAELYPGKRYAKSRPIRYRRFETAAEALRYLVEDMPPDLLRCTVMEVNEERFEADQIGALYNDEAYPLARA